MSIYVYTSIWSGVIEWRIYVQVELKCVEPSCVSYYYPDHLPDLGMPSSLTSAAQPQCTLLLFIPYAGAPVDEDEVVQSHDISPGDYVKVELDPEIFKAMHEGNEQAGWDDLMMEVLQYAWPKLYQSLY